MDEFRMGNTYVHKETHRFENVYICHIGKHSTVYNIFIKSMLWLWLYLKKNVKQLKELKMLFYSRSDFTEFEIAVIELSKF